MERSYFVLCLALGRLLRSARYSTVSIACRNGEVQVRKRRLFYAPLLVWMSGPLARLLDTGVQVLPQRDWEERERRLYRRLRGRSVGIDAAGTLVLPRLAGETLANLLEDPAVEDSVREAAIERAVIALGELHRLGFTHGDAMAENVLIDLAPRHCSRRPEDASEGGAGAAHWFDFETVHDPSRPLAWGCADDLRALLATCLVRTVPERRVEILQRILDVYPDEEVTRLLATSFASPWRRPLAFHLAQAGLPWQCFLEIGTVLRERSMRS
jgi:hypothetical protein